MPTLPFPAPGDLLAILVIIGGLLFNIGNVGGTGLSLNTISAIFPSPSSFPNGWALPLPVHLFAGILMIVLTLYGHSFPYRRFGEAFPRPELCRIRSSRPSPPSLAGIVGGYITFRRTLATERGNGWHRNLPVVNHVVLTGIMCYVL